MASIAVNQLPLAPLGAGDLIDRAVRLYRRHFSTLIRIAAPPVVISAAGGVLMSIGWRSLSMTSRESVLPVYVLLLITGFIMWGGGLILNIIVMGGAARNLVAHLLSDEAVTARATYSAVRSRFWALLAATLIVGFIAFITFIIVFYGAMIVIGMVAFGIVVFGLPAWLSWPLIILSVFTVLLAALWLFLLVAGRFAYVPQVMLVEGKGVFASVARSATLASRNVKRLMAMVLFSSFATYSALMILLVPLGWYGYLNGIDVFQLNSEQWPVWYAISYNVVAQMATMLLTPVWMLGLSLLYVDERVRHEGFDIELMASRRLGDIPVLAGGHVAPIIPALVVPSTQAPIYSSNVQPRPTERTNPGSTLGLS